ncbi:spore germination protein GerW family protein [Nocardiopsis trehalosi]|jgi:uncharacterized spore protein YtfJ|uniref:spore germination protein GerW family protein n=1 Tax=Nocardiopsis trehalosi TaxID=109329 RepID=UPI0008336D5B|nr:spore germination protein GerW family protein [Nocardiopsis trehalosi]
MGAEHVPAAVRADVESRARGSAELVDRLVAGVGGALGSRAVYGEPVRQGDVTVVPVARVFYGFGGGTDPGAGGRDGLGAGGSARPLGFIVLRDGQAEFRPIRTPAVAIVVPLALIAGATAARIVGTVMRHRGAARR